MTKNSTLLFTALAVGVIAAGEALGNAAYSPGGQTPFPLVVPAPAAYTTPLGLTGGAGMFTINGIGLMRDDTGMCTQFWATGNLPGAFPPPWNAAPMNAFTFRPELDPNYVATPGVPATNVDPLSHVVACEAVRQALLAARTVINAGGPGGAILMYIDPTTAAPGGGPLFANEFYKFQIIG